MPRSWPASAPPQSAWPCRCRPVAAAEAPRVTHEAPPSAAGQPGTALDALTWFMPLSSSMRTGWTGRSASLCSSVSCLAFTVSSCVRRTARADAAHVRGHGVGGGGRAWPCTPHKHAQRRAHLLPLALDLGQQVGLVGLNLLEQRQEVHQLGLVLLGALGLCTGAAPLGRGARSHAVAAGAPARAPCLRDSISSCTCSLMLSIMLPSRPSCASPPRLGEALPGSAARARAGAAPAGWPWPPSGPPWWPAARCARPAGPRLAGRPAPSWADGGGSAGAGRGCLPSRGLQGGPGGELEGQAQGCPEQQAGCTPALRPICSRDLWGAMKGLSFGLGGRAAKPGRGA